jgi:hypothetical protein
VGGGVPGKQGVRRRRGVAGGGPGRLHVPEGPVLRRAAVRAEAAQLWRDHDLEQVLRQEDTLHVPDLSWLSSPILPTK